MRFDLLVVLVLLGGCGPGSTPDAGLDAGDAAPPDAAPDALDTPVASCGERPGAPAWLEEGTAAHHRIARGTARDVHVWLFGDGTLRVRYVAAGSAPIERSWSRVPSLASLAGAAVTLGQEGDVAWLCTAEVDVRIERSGLVRVTARDGTVLLDDLEAATPSRVVRGTPAGELFLGLGERTGPLDRRGGRFVVRGTDAYDPAHGGFGPDADPLYLSIPFFVGVRSDVAYGLFTDVAHRLDYDVAATDADRYVIASSGPELDQWLFLGPTPREVLRRYTALTGRTPQPPRWALGFHQSRWGYDDAARVEAVAAELRSRAIPADAIWLDIQHLDRFRTFTFDPVRFADPEAMLARLRAEGFHVVAIADPGLAAQPDYRVYADALAGDLLLEDAPGVPHIDTAWPGDSAFLDLSAPGARALWRDEVSALASRGVAGIWLDVNEPTTFPESGGESTLPDALVAAGDGVPTTMAEVHNVYASLEAAATVEGLRAARPGERPFVLSRAGFAGIQRHAAVWTGDAPSTWWSLRQALPMLLGMGISGVPFVGSDVGGYSGHASPELYARWLELGAVSPFFRAHVTSGVPDQHPWSFGEEVEAIARERIRARYELLPYLESLFAEHVRTGMPPLRALALELFEEAALRRVEDEAMLGPYLLVAPVMDEGAATRVVRVPSGRWLDLASGALYEGPAEVTFDVTLAALPMLARPGTILPRRTGVGASTADVPTGPLTIDLYPSGTSRFVLHEDAGDGDAAADTELVLEATATGARFVFGARTGTFEPPAETVELRVLPVDGDVGSVTLDGVALERRADRSALEAAGSGFVHDANARAIVVRLPRPGAAGAVVELTYDAAITELRPPVDVTFEVTVPAGTPMTTAIHVASSATGWSHVPLAWVSPTLARGTLSVPRGSWFFYKVTRGGWDTVEKWLGCVEATNRYGYGAPETRHDTVAMWADWCL